MRSSVFGPWTGLAFSGPSFYFKLVLSFQLNIIFDIFFLSRPRNHYLLFLRLYCMTFTITNRPLWYSPYKYNCWANAPIIQGTEQTKVPRCSNWDRILSTGLSVCRVDSSTLHCTAFGRKLTRFNAAAIVVMVDVDDRAIHESRTHLTQPATQGRRQRASGIVNDRVLAKMRAQWSTRALRCFPEYSPISGLATVPWAWTVTRYAATDLRDSHQTDTLPTFDSSKL